MTIEIVIYTSVDKRFDESMARQPTFKFTRLEAEWPEYAWPALLMRYGPPPEGVKFYGKANRMHVTTKEASDYVDKITTDCWDAINHSGFMSHYTERYRQMLALNMKNKFLRWWHEWSRDR